MVVKTGSAVALRLPMARRRSRARVLLRALARHPRAVAGAGLLGLLVIAAALAPWIAPFGYDDQNLRFITRPPIWSNGSATFWLGTDQLGRDLFSRLLYGARISLLVGAVGVLAGGVVGVLLGLVAGFYGGKTDQLVMRLADVQLAFPYILLGIGIIAIAGPSLAVLVVVLSLRSWVLYARTVRAAVLSIREEDYLLAARASGATPTRQILVHVLPNTIPTIVVIGSLQLGVLILSESTLSFLGLGVQPPVPSWGGMLSDGRNYLASAPWLTLCPGLAISITVLAASLFGDGLRDALDPRLNSAGG